MLKDKTGAIAGGNVCAMQGIGKQWGCASPKPHLPVGPWQWRHISRAFGAWGAHPWGSRSKEFLVSFQCSRQEDSSLLPPRKGCLI